MLLGFYTKAKNFPPVLVRLLARVSLSGPALPSKTLGSRAELTPVYCEHIAQLPNWDTVPVGYMRAFTRACGIDLDDASSVRRVLDYLSKRPSFRYLMADKAWNDYYVPLVIIWLRSVDGREAELLPPVRKLAERLKPLLKIKAYGNVP